MDLLKLNEIIVGSDDAKVSEEDKVKVILFLFDTLLEIKSVDRVYKAVKNDWELEHKKVS